MNLFGILQVSSSALKAERVRAEITAGNMANAETTRTAAGGPFHRQHVVFSEAAARGGFASALDDSLARGGSGVQVAAVFQDDGAPLRRFDPGHPDADKDGYVSYPDINPATEMVDLMSASRSYGLNASAVQATKGMLQASIDLLK